MKRNLTKKEEQTIRFVHHDFKGLTVVETARIMRIHPRQVLRLLCSAKKKAPQLFPILTPRRVAVFQAWKNGLNRKDMAACLNLTEWQILKDCEFQYKHKFITARPATTRYANNMDDKVIQRF